MKREYSAAYIAWDGRIHSSTTFAAMSREHFKFLENRLVPRSEEDIKTPYLLYFYFEHLDEYASGVQANSYLTDPLFLASSLSEAESLKKRIEDAFNSILLHLDHSDPFSGYLFSSLSLKIAIDENKGLFVRLKDLSKHSLRIKEIQKIDLSKDSKSVTLSAPHSYIRPSKSFFELIIGQKKFAKADYYLKVNCFYFGFENIDRKFRLIQAFVEDLPRMNLYKSVKKMYPESKEPFELIRRFLSFIDYKKKKEEIIKDAYRYILKDKKSRKL